LVLCFGISVVEAMSAGLIPVVPDVGGNSEFVLQQYHYNTFKQAVEIILMCNLEI
jgi:glycosyltransferase involved in cell wall biosynthesis